MHTVHLELKECLDVPHIFKGATSVISAQMVDVVDMQHGTAIWEHIVLVDSRDILNQVMVSPYVIMVEIFAILDKICVAMLNIYQVLDIMVLLRI
jgi:hypothetical protein